MIILKTSTPTAEPRRPPTTRIFPILKSTALLFRCAKTPEKEDAAIWCASGATATAAGIPRSIKSGVMRNPPPMPKTPDRKPTAAPSIRRTNKSTGTSAIGRKICIRITFLAYHFDGSFI